jgi:hypothetical protein
MNHKKILPVMTVVACAFLAPAAPLAQSPVSPTQQKPPAAEQPPPPAARPLFLAGARKSGPLGGSATVGVLIPLRSPERGTGYGSSWFVHQGVLLEAAAADDGFELAAGWGRRWTPRRGPVLYGRDIMATAFRRTNLPSRATYVGGEVGLTMMTLRMSVGAATRVDGPADADRTIFTWGIGFHSGR